LFFQESSAQTIKGDVDKELRLWRHPAIRGREIKCIRERRKKNAEHRKTLKLSPGELPANLNSREKKKGGKKRGPSEKRGEAAQKRGRQNGTLGVAEKKRTKQDHATMRRKVPQIREEWGL